MNKAAAGNPRRPLRRPSWITRPGLPGPAGRPAIPASGSPPGRSPSGPTGSIQVKIRELRDPAGLQRRLRAADTGRRHLLRRAGPGVPGRDWGLPGSGAPGSADHGHQPRAGVLTVYPKHRPLPGVLIIRPAAIPPHAGWRSWARTPGQARCGWSSGPPRFTPAHGFGSRRPVSSNLAIPTANTQLKRDSLADRPACVARWPLVSWGLHHGAGTGGGGHRWGW